MKNSTAKHLYANRKHVSASPNPIANALFSISQIVRNAKHYVEDSYAASQTLKDIKSGKEELLKWDDVKDTY